MSDFGTILRDNSNDLTLYSDNIILNGVNVKNTLTTLQTEIDSLTPNPNAWNNGNGQTITNQQILFTDNTNNGAITSDKLYFDTANNFIYLNEEIMPVRSEIDTINSNITTINTNITIINGQIATLQGDTQTNTEQVSNLTNRVNDLETLTSTQQTDIINLQTNVSTLNQNVLDLQEEDGLLQTQINDLASNITTNTTDITQLQTQTTSLQTYANSAMLRAMNCNNWSPTTSFNIVWSNLTAQEQLEWKGLDPATIDPVQSLTGNYWNFTKNLVNSNKIGWYIPVDLSGLTFQDLESFWCVIRFNTTTNISTEGSIYFQITTSPPTGLNTFRTRINYSNQATPMNQTGYFYKIYALDTITTTTTGNFGKGQEIDQQKFKLNPCNVRPDLWSIPFNKLVASPTGDTGAGYTLAPIQSISLQTASNINTFNFDVVSFGYLNKQYNLSFV